MTGGFFVYVCRLLFADFLHSAESYRASHAAHSSGILHSAEASGHVLLRHHLLCLLARFLRTLNVALKGCAEIPGIIAVVDICLSLGSLEDC